MLNNIEKLRGLSQEAFEFYKKVIGEELAVGRYELGNGVYAFLSEYTPKNKDESSYEAHKKYIDVQIILSGSEIIAVESVDIMHSFDCLCEYTPEKDIELYACNNGGKDYMLSAGDFIILLPTDAHMPGVFDGMSKTVKKAVIKIPVR